MTRTGEAGELARRISMDQAHAHTERHVQRAVNDVVYWATRMVESNDQGEVVTGEVRDNLNVALREVQALSEAQTTEAVAWWIGRYLERQATQPALATGEESSARTQVEQAAPTH
jgi:phosphotransacetylase